MANPRYKVTTCRGRLTTRVGGHDGPLGLSASVLDTLDCHRVVTEFRSEDRVPRQAANGNRSGSTNRGVEGAIAAARTLADRLNAVDALG